MREARFAQNRRQRAPRASVRPGPTRPRPLVPTAVHCRVAAGSAGAHALTELAVTAAAHKSHTPGKRGGPHPGNRVVPCQEIRWSSPQEIRWVRTEEILHLTLSIIFSRLLNNCPKNVHDPLPFHFGVPARRIS